MNNLLRRKLRSMLTMLGVVIGTAAIVVTISLGVGAQEAQMEMLEAQTNLRVINVSPYWGGYGSAENTTGNRITKINDSVISRIRHTPGVAAVTPVVNLYANMEFVLQTGKLENSTYLIAVSPNDFAKIVGLKNGRYFTGSTDRMEFLMSEMSMVEFRDPEKEDEYIDAWSYLYSGQEIPLPDVNWLHDQFTLQLRWEDYSNTDENNPDPKVYTKDYKARFMGTLDVGSDDWTFMYGAVVNLNWLKRLQRDNKELFKEMGIENSALTEYQNVYVLADTVDDVVDVVKDLTEMGVMCSSPLDYLNTYKEQIQTVQGFLGFIGAISMLVAALSIANTMMMSIYERTREIGVMKVLGCELKNIRQMFLIESGFIGFIGGVAGALLSWLVSLVLNNLMLLAGLLMGLLQSLGIQANLDLSFLMNGGMTSSGTMSEIPPWLILAALAFATGIGILSGIAPANRAVKISALEAIRHE